MDKDNEELPEAPKIMVQLDNDGEEGIDKRPESWDLTLRSVDSAFSSSQLSLEMVNAMYSDNEGLRLRRANSRTSSASSLVSESLVDAGQAGILGGMLDISLEGKSVGIPHKSDAPSLSIANSTRISYDKSKRSVATDPGVYEDEEGYEGRSATSYGHTIGEDHVNFILMYDMLTGIRHSVSVCQAKPSRPLTDEDFRYARTYNFLQSSNDTTPSKYEFRFKDYCPWVFRSLREAFRIDAADYLVSLTGKYVLSEIDSPGKSGSFFYFSQDFRYIIKTIKQIEHEFVRRILRQYYEHVRRNPNSLLTRFYGLHRVRMSNVKKIYFVVMGNVFPPHKDIHETFDLKGSTKGRFVSAEELSKRHLATLKDLNWIQKKRKLKLGPEKATLLMNQLNADCLFLAKMRIMDYSLLVGIHYMSRGNEDNIREKSMKVLEPTTPLIGGTAAFKRSSIKTVPSSDPIPQERRMCIFYSEDGGFRSSHRNGTLGDELYFLGVIDILTPYSVKKRIEHVFRSIKDDALSISAVNPIDYSRRFLRFMAENILQDTESDYATKKLPRIPDYYSTFEHSDAVVIEEEDHQ